MVGKGPWTQQEDDLLKEHVRMQNGANAWGKVAEALGSRSAKQCRERWHQNLKPGLNHEPISEEESRFVIHMVATRGKRWAEIARSMNGRSDNMIKNWWNGSNNRRQRQQMDEQHRVAGRRPSAPNSQQQRPVLQQQLPQFVPRDLTVQPTSYPFAARQQQPQSAVEYHQATSPSYSPSFHAASAPTSAAPRVAPTSQPSSPYYQPTSASARYTNTAARHPTFRHSDIPTLPPLDYERSALDSPGASSVASAQPPPSLAYSSRTPSAQASPFNSPDTPTAQYPELPLPQIYTSDAVDRRDSKQSNSGAKSPVGQASHSRIAITSILN